MSHVSHAVVASDEDEQLRDQIWNILFPKHDVNFPRNGTEGRLRKWNNRMCDCLMMHTYIKYGGEVFITLDQNFSKQSKVGQLVELGAGEIATPEEFLSSFQ